MNSSPNALIAADISGDGFPDLITSVPAAYGAAFFQNQGDGTFAGAVILPTGTADQGPYYVAVGDFNHDGLKDIAGCGSSNQATGLWVWTNQGSSTFSSPSTFALPSGSYCSKLGAADLDGDGTDELVAITNKPGGTGPGDGPSASVYFSNTTGGFRPPVSYPILGSSWLVFADLDHDGKLDLVTAGCAVNVCTLTTLLNYGNGTLGPATTKTITGSGGQIAAGDINQDGLADIVMADYPAQTVSIYLSRGDGTFRGPFAEPLGYSPGQVDVADMNGDGLTDIITSAYSPYVDIMLNVRTNAFQFPEEFALDPAGMALPYFLIVSDLNGDGRSDIATANSGTRNISVMLAR